MCDLSEGYCDVWIERWIRARKTHACMACRESIHPGETYHRTKWVS